MADFGAVDLAVVIPTHGRAETLRRTLDALRRQTVSGFETVVIVDGTDQPVPEDADARVLVKEHGGPGAARNHGARATRRPLLLFLGDDMVPEQTLVERHLSRHNQHPERTLAVLGQVAWHPDSRGGRLLRWLDWSATQFDYRWIEGEEAGFGRFFSCNVSLKREIFLEVGGFDEDFVFYYEDLDCGYRLAEAGMRLVYEPAARVHHLHSYDWPAIVGRFEGVAKGERLMSIKHPWFEPWFAQRMRWAENAPRRAVGWTFAADLVPRKPARLRQAVEGRADTAYCQQLAPAFFSSWEGQEGIDELKSYLGRDFDERRLQESQREVEIEEERAPDEATFYRTSEAYLYDLTAFATWPTKVPYFTNLWRFAAPGARVLDYGCGIGSDGLRLLAAGYRVGFADFDNPSTRFLKWRLARRGLEAPVFDVDGHVPDGWDLAYSFDVIEHVDDPFAFLHELERRARLVAVNFLEPDPDDTHLHRPLPIRRLLDHAARRGLLRYRRYHGRSHLVIYRTDHARLRRTRSLGERYLGPILPGVS